METIKELSYIDRVLVYLRANNLVAPDFEVDHKASIEAGLEKHWGIWSDLLRILAKEAELETVLPRRFYQPEMRVTDILDDGKSQAEEKQTLSASSITWLFVVFFLVKHEELEDEAKYFDFLLRFFVCLQTLHSKQVMVLLNTVPGYVQQWQPQYNPVVGFGGQQQVQFNQQQQAALQQAQAAFQQAQANSNAFQHCAVPPVVKINRVAELIEGLTDKLVLCRKSLDQ